LLYASSEIVYFSTREVSSSHPPADIDVGSASITWMRYLQPTNILNIAFSREQLLANSSSKKKEIAK
jgi:hypothetical protein